MRQFLCLTLIIIFVSCFNSSDQHREEGKVFHAAGASGGIGGIYFALYKDNQYQVCETGGIGQSCYEGKYFLSGDTITLNDLSRQSYLKSSRLVICRYKDQDSMYWKWKYPRQSQQWEVMRDQDLASGNAGDVHQIDLENRLFFDPAYYFVISLDSLTNYR